MADSALSHAKRRPGCSKSHPEMPVPAALTMTILCPWYEQSCKKDELKAASSPCQAQALSCHAPPGCRMASCCWGSSCRPLVGPEGLQGQAAQEALVLVRLHGQPVDPVGRSLGVHAIRQLSPCLCISRAPILLLAASRPCAACSLLDRFRSEDRPLPQGRCVHAKHTTNLHTCKLCTEGFQAPLS